jgi:tRNA(adenine34) deaminase
MNDKIFKTLMNLSKKASKKDDIPVAALITYNNKIISKAYNTRNIKNITINHAEILAIIKANKRLKSWRLNKCTLYVTVEPCEMCKSVINESRIGQVYYFLPRLPEKKQYNKTNFEQITHAEFTKNYQQIIQNFWKNKR